MTLTEIFRSDYPHSNITITRNGIDWIYHLFDKNNIEIKRVTLNYRLPCVAIDYPPYDNTNTSGWFMQGEEADNFIDEITIMTNKHKHLREDYAIFLIAEDYYNPMYN